MRLVPRRRRHRGQCGHERRRFFDSHERGWRRMLMKRIIAFLFGSALLGLLPASATMVTLTGAGGVTIGAGPLTPPTLVPQLSAALDPNLAQTATANVGFLTNGGGAAGAFYWPST